MLQPFITNTFCEPCGRRAGTISDMARERMIAGREIKLLSDWSPVVFIHFETDPHILQKEVPFELDLFEGRAYVSVIAFHLKNMRPKWGGLLTAWMMRPVGTHELLNIRAYVRHRGEPGIYFLAEYLPNRISLQFGPRLCGLPYRWARLHYKHRHEQGEIEGNATDRIRHFSYKGMLENKFEFRPCDGGTSDEFLLERYTAFTYRRGVERFFHIWHPPWLQTPVEINIESDKLLATTGRWFKAARFAGAHYSPGFKDVWMGWPKKIA